MSVTDRHAGIPENVIDLSRRLPAEWDGKDWYKLHPGLTPNNIAAIIVEPDNPDYLSRLREYCDQEGIVLIFDEIITGFRYDMGGAQKLFEVTPDLATFGKSMANGMPISALVGRKDIMKRCAPPDNIFYSGTFFGETLSMAAALATIEKMQRENVIEHLWHKGAYLEGYMAQTIIIYGLQDVVKLGGEAPRITIDFKDHEGATAQQIRSFFMAKMIQEGILVINGNNISYAHKTAEVNRIMTAYKATFEAMAAALHDGSMRDTISAKGQPVRASA